MLKIEERSALQNWAICSMGGVLRGATVSIITQPLDVFKTIKQSNLSTASEGSYKIALRLLKEEGASGLYRGLPAQLSKILVRQVWTWPFMVHVPPKLAEKNLSPTLQQLITGVSIATIEVTTSNAIEKIRAQRMAGIKKSVSFKQLFSGTDPISMKQLLKDGYKGYSAHWLKLSSGWSSFLVLQRHFRDQERAKAPEQPLDNLQLVVIGIKVAFITSAITGPVDTLNTMKQTRDVNISSFLFSRKWVSLQGTGELIRTLYKGSSFRTANLLIQNVASVFFLEQLSRITLKQ